MDNTEKDIHITSDNVKPGIPGGNPISSPFNITVSIPESIDIKMVDASALTDFEIWIYISSLLSNLAIGFWISFSLNIEPKLDRVLTWVSGSFTILFVVAILVAKYKRRLLSKKTRKFSVQATNG